MVGTLDDREPSACRHDVLVLEGPDKAWSTSIAPTIISTIGMNPVTAGTLDFTHSV
jgi:hypothetical protein